jgi:hypothetical protein
MYLRASWAGVWRPSGLNQKRLQFSAPSSIRRMAPRSVRGGSGSAASSVCQRVSYWLRRVGQALGHGRYILRQHADQHLGVVAVAQDGLQVRGAGRFQPRPGIGEPGGGGGNGVVELAHAGFVHRHQQVLLGREVVVERARQHLRAFGDVAHGGGGVAALGKAARGSVQQAGQAVVGPGRVGWPRAGRGRSGRGGKAVHQDMEPLSERLFG